MFYQNENLAFRLLGVYRVYGKPKRAVEQGRRHTAISFRIKGNSMIMTKNGSLSLHDGAITYFPAGADYERVTYQEEEYVAVHLQAFGEDGMIIETIPNCQTLYPIFETLLYEWERSGGSRNRCMLVLYRLFDELSRMQIGAHEDIPVSIRAGVEKLHTDFRSEELTIAALAAQCHVSETYFRRVFTRHFGTSPMDMLQELRFDYAKNLLRAGYYETKEVALLSGFPT